MRRRDFITAVSSLAVACAEHARAQQAMPMAGFLDTRSRTVVSENECALFITV
jgi:hypothetical protein